MFTKRDLRKLIIPLIIEQILVVSVGMADTVMVTTRGEAAVSGIALVDTISVLVISLFAALATGGAVVASQYLGHKEPKNAVKAANQLVLSMLVLSICLLIVSIVFNQVLLSMIYGNIEASVMQNARIYFYFSAVSYPFLALYNAGAALFRAMGNSKISMYISILMNLINVIGNAIFLFGYQMGVEGVALATLISRIVAAAVIIQCLRNQQNKIYIHPKFKFGFDWKMIGKILHIGVPNGIENSLFQLGKIIVSRLLTSFGTTAIAANAVAATVCGFGTIPGNAISLAMITVVGQCIGAGDLDQVKKYTKSLMKTAYLLMGIINVFILLGASVICSIYILSPETSELAVLLLRLHAGVCIFIWPLSFVLPNALRAANDVRYTMTVSVFSMWIFRIAFSFILANGFGFGAVGVWLAMFIDWLCRAFLFTTRFLAGKWKISASII